MLINGKDVLDYGATLLSADIENADIVNSGEFWAENSLTPFHPKQKTRWGKVTCEFLVEQENDDEAEKAISRLIGISKSAELVFEDRTLKYKGVIEGKDKDWISPGKYELILTWKCELPYEDEITHNFAGGTTIHLDSNEATPVILEITHSENLDSASIIGFGEAITLKNLTAGQTIIIDGEKGLVTENGQNKWLDYDSWGFPRLEPGENNITVDTNTLDITIRYKPRWI